MSTVAAAWALAQKDIRSFLRDRTAMLLSILVPIALVSVFGWIMAYAFGGSGGMPQVSLHVADLDQSSASRRFVEKLSNTDMLRVRTVALEPGTHDPGDMDSGEFHIAESQLEKLIRDGDAHHILVLPKDFDKSLDSNQLPNLRMLRDPGRAMEDQIVQISIMQAAMTELGGTIWVDGMDRILGRQGMDANSLSAIRGWMTNIGETISDFAEQETAVLQATEHDNLAPPPATDSAKQHLGVQAKQEEESEPIDSNAGPQALLEIMQELVPIETSDVSPPNRAKQVTYQQAQSVAGMSVMMLLFALTSCGSVLLTEREEGTLRRLFAQPISRNSILLGKFMFVLIVGLGQMAILFAYGEWMFRVGLFRDPMTLVVLTVTWVATGGAFGMFLASVSRSTKQAESLASLLILMMAALGGCWFPLQMMNLPPLLDTVCKSTMTYWAMTGFQGMLWSQLPWYASKTLTALGWQWAWTIGLTLLSIYFFRRNFCRG